MNKYFKKFSIMFAMSLVLVFGSCVSAFAITYSKDGAEIGESNLNNTNENSAKQGDVIKHPEKGWKRYDDTDNPKITYSGGWVADSNNLYYKGTMHYEIKRYNPNSYAYFKFYGDKLRIIGNSDGNSCKININIDETDYNPVIDTSENKQQTVVFEKLCLDYGVHTVKITNKSGNDEIKDMQIDAIDIDENGNLIDFNESITLNKSTMNLTQENSNQLTAITTPVDTKVTWITSDSSIATVDSTGKVTGVKEGNCTITATTADGLTATCTVTVTKQSSTTNPNANTGTTTDNQCRSITNSHGILNWNTPSGFTQNNNNGGNGNSSNNSGNTNNSGNSGNNYSNNNNSNSNNNYYYYNNYYISYNTTA